MAAFVDCTKYNSDKAQTDQSISNLVQQDELTNNQINDLKRRATQSEQCCTRNNEAIQAVARKVDAGVKTTGPLNGKGTAAEPLGLNLGPGLTIDSNGNLLVGAIPPDNIRNFITNKYKLGMSTFFGNINKDTGDFVAGVPINIGSDEPTQGRAMSLQQVTGQYTDYDFNGYYIATPHQVDVWLQGVGSTAWYIMNDKGLNSDGTLVDPNGWGLWQKLDNVGSITNAVVKSLQDQVNGLSSSLANANREIQILKEENRKTCKASIVNVDSHTVVDTNNVISSTGGTVTFPVLPQGRMFTVIQTTANQVTLAGNGVTLVAPRNGTLKLGGQNAAVTVIYVADNRAHVFGDVEAT